MMQDKPRPPKPQRSTGQAVMIFALCVLLFAAAGAAVIAYKTRELAARLEELSAAHKETAAAALETRDALDIYLDRYIEGLSLDIKAPESGEVIPVSGDTGKIEGKIGTEEISPDAAP